MIKNSYDVVIVGGGMVGALLASAIAHSNLRIAVVEAMEPAAFAPEQQHDLRVSAISVASRLMLEAVGAWDKVLSKRYCPYRRMLVWDGQAGGKTLFDSGDIAQPVLGHIVENRVLQLSLIETLKQHDNIEWLCPNKVTSIQLNEQNAVVDLQSGISLTCKLLVGADGARSVVRSMADIQISPTPYQQHALVASIRTRKAQQDITWQRFVPSGPQAFLPLSGNNASMVWYNTPEEVERLKALDDTQFIAEMETVFPERLGGIEKVLARASFPLIKSHAKDYVKNRLVLIGDAAHTIHPLAGQGVNLGMMDAAQLSQLIVTTHKAGKDFGRLRYLRRYERSRRGHNQAMITAMDGFYHAFSDQPAVARVVRSMALNLADSVTPVKNMLMKYAMGVAGDQPDLAKGRIPS